jgi:hypothetical protein
VENRIFFSIGSESFCNRINNLIESCLVAPFFARIKERMMIFYNIGDKRVIQRGSSISQVLSVNYSDQLHQPTSIYREQGKFNR